MINPDRGRWGFRRDENAVQLILLGVVGFWIGEFALAQDGINDLSSTAVWVSHRCVRAVHYLFESNQNLLCPGTTMLVIS